jgi:hypothetical protein
MKKKYLIWLFIPFILVFSIYLDANSIDILFPPVTFYSGIICLFLLIMGFVYGEIEIRKTGNILESIIINLCLFYSLFYPFIFVIGYYRLGINWMSSFMRSTYTFRLFVISQVISILILLLIAIRERKNWKK